MNAGCRGCSGDSDCHAVACPKDANAEIARLKRKCNSFLRKLYEARESLEETEPNASLLKHVRIERDAAIMEAHRLRTERDQARSERAVSPVEPNRFRETFGDTQRVDTVRCAVCDRTESELHKAGCVIGKMQDQLESAARELIDERHRSSNLATVNARWVETSNRLARERDEARSEAKTRSNRCTLHDDCDAADSAVRDHGGKLAYHCHYCRDTGVIETSNNDEPCDCHAGNSAQFNVAGMLGPVTGRELKKRRR